MAEEEVPSRALPACSGLPQRQRALCLEHLLQPLRTLQRRPLGTRRGCAHKWCRFCLSRHEGVAEPPLGSGGGGHFLADLAGSHSGPRMSAHGLSCLSSRVLLSIRTSAKGSLCRGIWEPTELSPQFRVSAHLCDPLERVHLVLHPWASHSDLHVLV